ncbi:head GIN domain-containing protein [Maribellus maritimus]|uniref:head GIN domain-containing protein n=1 Tax=Maribellus maritimus TaxID=2870838 RepID=UPI001EEA1D83|nr:head GIN domain-containing protein [Maribellus maritimus]MCG6189085.1 DUF2807 domain-containing protein [Maribellus maritimus]
MKTKIFILTFLFVTALFINPLFAEDEEREVSSFSEISLRVPGKLYLEQGKTQSVEIVAKSSTMEEIVTEVNGRRLTIRFKNKNYFFKSFNPGKIEIYITVPEIDALAVSGSGDIIAEDEIKTRILDLAVSGSGDINLAELDTERVKASISGSGDIVIGSGGVADDLSVSISGSGDVKAEDFEAEDVVVRIAGSGNCSVTSNGSLKARVAGSGSVYYHGSPSIDSSVAGSGRVKKM